MANTSYTIPVSIQRLIKSYTKQRHEHDQLEHVPKVKVRQAIGKVAFFYEKIRNALDYKEENLLIKTSIERIIRRRFVAGADSSTIAKPLTVELIRSGYVANQSLPEAVLEEITKVIVKYADCLSIATPPLDQAQREEVFDWLVRLLACEIADIIASSSSQQGMVEFMYLTMLERVDILSDKISEDERKVQIYTAVLRTYTQYDADLTSYHLLCYFYPAWRNNQATTIQTVAQHILSIKTTLEKQIQHPLQERLIRQFKKINILFVILHDVFVQQSDTLSLLQQPDKFDNAVQTAVQEKYKEIKSKLRRRSVRSIIYLFATKMVLALVIELPYDLYFLGEINKIPLLVNVIFHPLLLFVIALAVHIPAKENTQRIKEGIRDLVYRYKGKNITYRIRPKTKRRTVASILFQLLYGVTFIITFGCLIAILYMLHFNWLGGLLFVTFLTLVSFFGLRVRQLARDVVVLDRADNFFSATIDFFAIPIVRAGRWLSIKFSKINVFIFVLDVIIEAPFKLIIDIFEQWMEYIREKREEIYD
ncbi:MAG: hypothetical protein WCW27_06310 [Patescibacteria group bacterium]|jgi:hypothetical protein